MLYNVINGTRMVLRLFHIFDCDKLFYYTPINNYLPVQAKANHAIVFYIPLKHVINSRGCISHWSFILGSHSRLRLLCDLRTLQPIKTIQPQRAQTGIVFPLYVLYIKDIQWVFVTCYKLPNTVLYLYKAKYFLLNGGISDSLSIKQCSVV